MQKDGTWYQEHFSRLKAEFQTREQHDATEALVLLFCSTPCRVIYLRVDATGVTVRADYGVSQYVNWQRSDLLEHLKQTLLWMASPVQESPPHMGWDQDAVWEIARPLVRCEVCGAVYYPDEGYYEIGQYSYCAQCCHW